MKYYCKGCDQIIVRDVSPPTLNSWCSSTDNKLITMVRVDDNVAEIFNQLKKLSLINKNK